MLQEMKAMENKSCFASSCSGQMNEARRKTRASLPPFAPLRVDASASLIPCPRYQRTRALGYAASAGPGQ